MGFTRVGLAEIGQRTRVFERPSGFFLESVKDLRKAFQRMCLINADYVRSRLFMSGQSPVDDSLSLWRFLVLLNARMHENVLNC